MTVQEYEKKAPKEELVANVIRALDTLKEQYPDTEIIVDTSNGSLITRIGDALIYDTIDNCVVLDSE